MSQQKSQQAYLSVATGAAAADNITALTAASPPVVTSNSHGIANGSIVVLASVGGMVQVNNRAFVVASSATNTFELKGVDGSAYSAYTSGGTATAQTMSEVGYVRGIGPGFDGESPEIDVTHLRSLAKEYLLGLQDFGNVGVRLWLPSTADTAQARLRALKESASTAAFSITLASGQIAAFMGLVKSFSFDELAADGAVGGTVNLRVTGAPAWFA